MSYFNGQILTLDEVKESIEEKLPCNYQIGQEVFVGINQLPVRGYLVGVRICKNHAIYYDVAVNIKDTTLYSVIRDVRGFVWGLDEEPLGFDGGLMLSDDFQEVLKDFVKDQSKPRLSLVYTKSEGE